MYKISLRSKSHINVASIANKLNGGGHIRAAGAIFNGKLTQLQKTLVQLTEVEFNK